MQILYRASELGLSTFVRHALLLHSYSYTRSHLGAAPYSNNFHLSRWAAPRSSSNRCCENGERYSLFSPSFSLLVVAFKPLTFLEQGFPQFGPSLFYTPLTPVRRLLFTLLSRLANFDVPSCKTEADLVKEKSLDVKPHKYSKIMGCSCYHIASVTSQMDHLSQTLCGSCSHF